jgi:hypothetical protein
MPPIMPRVPVPLHHLPAKKTILQQKKRQPMHNRKTAAAQATIKPACVSFDSEKEPEGFETDSNPVKMDRIDKVDMEIVSRGGMWFYCIEFINFYVFSSTNKLKLAEAKRRSGQ